MRQDEVAARDHMVPERRDNLCRILLVGHEMQDGDHEYRDRLGPVDQMDRRWVVNDLPRAAQVMRGGDYIRGFQQLTAERGDHRVVVDVQHTGIGKDLPGDFVDWHGCRITRSDVDVLIHALFGYVAHRALHEGPVLKGGKAYFRGDGQGLLCGLAVGR